MSTRVNVLKALEENKGNVISGEELANRLDISRAAIWKAIQELRKEGYCIDAVTNKGYRLAHDSDVLSPEGILPYVKGDLEGRVHVFRSLESTNLTARKMALEGAVNGTVVVTEEQTRGKGRMGRGFHSPPGGGIYMSIILKPQLEAAKSVLITTAASVAVCKAIENVTGIRCQIKWVNDIYKDEKKICGILTEAVSDFESGRIEHIVLGIGINYRIPPSAFPKEIRRIAGSLFEDEIDKSTCAGNFAEGEPQRNRLIAEVINQVMEVHTDLEARTFIEEYKERSIVLGKEILIIPTIASGGERDLSRGIPATVLDLDGDGGLIVRYQDGSVKTLNSGEISIRTIKS